MGGIEKEEGKVVLALLSVIYDFEEKMNASLSFFCHALNFFCSYIPFIGYSKETIGYSKETSYCDFYFV